MRSRKLLPRDQRRLLLLRAAGWVFAHKGYRNAAISDIIARAGVARGTFYRHFQSKDAVFLAILEDFHSRLLDVLGGVEEAVALAASHGARAALHTGFRRWLEFFDAHRDAATIVLKEATSIDPRFERGLAELRRSALSHLAARVRAFQERGLARASLSPELVAHFQLGMFDELLNVFVLQDAAVDLDALAAELVDFQWSGLIEPGIDRR